MGNYRYEYCLIVLLTILSMLCITVAAQASTNIPEFAGGIDPKTVISQNDAMKIFKKCSVANNSDDYQNCILTDMHKNHATAQAIAFYKFASGWITDYKNYNYLTVIHEFVPAADHNDAYYVMNNKGDFLDVDDMTIINGVDITKNANYKDIVSRYPSASVWPGNHQGFPDVTTSPENSPRLIFTYSLLNGCHACEVAGTAKIGLDFDNDGAFVDATLLDLTPTPQQVSPAAQSAATAS